MALKRIEKNIICITLIFLLSLILPLTYLAFDHYVIKANWPDTKLDKEYLSWRKLGGNYKESYYDQLVMDVNRKKLIEGLNEKEILNKIPNLTNGDVYSSGTYKSQYSSHYYSSSGSEKVTVYWLNSKDGFDWCVVISKNKIELKLIKG